MHDRVIQVFLFLMILGFAGSLAPVAGQTPTPIPTPVYNYTLYLDQVAGMTADEAVAYAIKNNAELEALRREA